MKGPIRNTRMRILWSMLVLTILYTTSFSMRSFLSSDQPDPVTLIVQSSCAPTNVRLSTGETLKTPFQRTLTRGQIITIEVLDSSVPTCDALDVVTPFRRLIVNREPLPKRQTSAQITLERDTTVLAHYGRSDVENVTLSVWSSCEYPSGASVRISEPSVVGQEGTFRTHFSANFLSGQTVRLQAVQEYLQCGDTGGLLEFLRWSAGGKVFPDEQAAIDITLDQYTTAVAHYGSRYFMPQLRVNSFQLFRGGEPADFIKRKDEFSNYTIVLNGEMFPADAGVWTSFGNPSMAEIIRLTPNQIEARLPAGRSKKVGVTTVLVLAPGMQSNAIPVVVNRK
jgi:hypothetical protein